METILVLPSAVTAQYMITIIILTYHHCVSQKIRPAGSSALMSLLEKKLM